METQSERYIMDELEAGESLVEALLPVGAFLLSLLYLCDATSDTRPQLLWIKFKGLTRGVFEGIAVHEHFLANSL